MSSLLQFFIWLPLVGFFSSLFISRKSESFLSGIAISTFGLHLVGSLIFVAFWFTNKNPTLDVKHIVLFKAENTEIFIDFYFDKITATFTVVGSLIAMLVAIFSRYYMHREKGFKRFFSTTLFFFLGYNLVILSGNFETLFIGWEILGICSFLLIAFYRDRYLPVKNGLKVISVYRLADICLILGMWMSHHLWHENITFLKLTDIGLVENQLQGHYSLGIFISLMVFIAATIKSAQLPFSSWLPRAMEGPTTSSAVFYGSLSVHLGVFILLRTFPFWESLLLIKVLIILTGLATAVIATGIARVQSTVKTQIAYSSIAQIGFIFMEVALGFHTLALVHFAGNAFFRTYQLLVSPSVLSYLVHDQFYNFKPGTQVNKDLGFKRLRNTLYILSIKEWNLDLLLYRFLWSPFKWIGSKLDFLSSKASVIILVILYFFGVYSFSLSEQFSFHGQLPYIFAFIALTLIVKAFTSRGDATKVWMLIATSQFFIALAIALNKQFDFTQLILYLSGGVISSILGYICLSKIKSIDNDIDLNKFHGYTYEHPKLALVFLLSCLGLVAFPITPTFIGFDLLLTHIQHDQIILIIVVALYFVLIEISALRVYARIFMGQHKKAYHAMAFRSS